MKALSIQQPWAWLIVRGSKDIENRSWHTDFRGRFLIHAGKTVDWPAYFDLLNADPETPSTFEMGMGGIVGVAKLDRVVVQHPSRWFQGPCGFVLENRRPTPFVPLRGRLGFFNVADDVTERALS